MSLEAERIRKLVENGMLVDAVELPSNHKRKVELITDVEEALSQFDDDADYAHFVVRVKRSEKALPSADQIVSEQDLSLDQLVTETLELGREISEQREQKEKQEIPAPAPEESDPSFLFANARVLSENGEYALARKIYKSLIQKGQMIARSLFGIAQTCELENRVDEAVRFYEEAIAYSSEAEYYQALTALQIRNGRYEEATETLTRALGVPGLDDIRRFDFHKSLGNCWTRLNQADKAEYHYLQAYELNPDSDVLQVNVGSLALQKNDAESARKHFDRALELNTKNDKALTGLGSVFSAKNEPKKAQGYFLAALRINPENLTALFNLAKTAYQTREFASAARQLGAYVSSHPGNPNILYTFAGILYHQGEVASAKAEAEKILLIDPDHAGAKELLALIERSGA